MEDSDFLISKQNYKVTLMKTVCLAKRKTHGMTEQNWESRNISTHRVKWFLTKKLRNFTEERIVRIVFSTSVTGQIRCPYTKKRKKERKRTLTHILYYKQKWIKSRSAYLFYEEISKEKKHWRSEIKASGFDLLWLRND